MVITNLERALKLSSDTASQFFIPEIGYFGDTDVKTGILTKHEHLTARQIQSLQLWQLPIAGVRFSYDHIADKAQPVVQRITEVRCVISRRELMEIDSVLSNKYKNVIIENVVIDTLMKDAIYLTVPNYYLKDEDDALKVKSCHISKSFSAQADEVRVRYTELSLAEDFDDPLKGGEIFNPYGYEKSMPGMDFYIVVPYASTVYS